MEFLSPSQLHKYEAIINEINEEYEKAQKLNDELKKVNNSIVVYNLVKSGVLEKLSNLDVKIFSNIIELLNLYAEELGDNVPTNNMINSCYKYYLIEIYISPQLLDKLSKSDWFVVISVQNANFHISKTVNLPRKSNIIVDVVPVMKNVIECCVEVYLVNIQDNNTMKLNSIDIDISFHFHKYNKKRTEDKSDILQLTKLYNTSLDKNFLMDLSPLEYQITAPLEKEKFIEILLNNSYHNLDLNLFADLHNESKTDFKVQICAYLYKIEVTFNRKDILNIKASFNDIQKLKKYFLNMLHKEGETCKEISGLMELKNASVLNYEDAIALYHKTRKLSSILPA